MMLGPTHSTTPEYQCLYCGRWTTQLYEDPAWRSGKTCCYQCAGDRLEAQMIWYIVVLIVLAATAWAMVELWRWLASLQ